MRHSLFVLLILSMAIASFGIEVKVKYDWKCANFTWESPKQRKAAMKAGDYDPKKCLFYDADIANDGTIFITLPRELGRGSPASLVTVDRKKGPEGPLLSPYPDWSWHTNCTCYDKCIVNVHRVHIRCNYIFVLDNGKIGTEQRCDPKLLIFNLNNDTLIKTIPIPRNIATDNTGDGLLVTPIVYLPGKCSNLLNEMIIFMADMEGSGLVMYDSSTKRMCRIESDFMKPNDGSFSVANVTFSYTGGLLGLTISCNDLYHASASRKEIYKISIKTLRECPDKNEANRQTKLVTKLQSQTGPITSAGRAIIYSDSKAMSIVGMNVCKKSGINKVVLAQDSEKLQSVSGLKVSPCSDIVLGFSNRQYLFIKNKLDLNKKNFKLWTMSLTKSVKETNSLS